MNKYIFIGVVMALILIFFAVRYISIKLILKPAYEKYGCSCYCEANHE